MMKAFLILIRKHLINLWLSLTLMMLSGCSTVGYYAQAIHGQADLMNRRQEVAELLRDPTLPAPLRERLQRVQQLRDFASDELHLPNNGSYRSYADLQRPFAVYSVVVTPELSLVPKSFCFFIIGCIQYKGYFNQTAAEQFAESFRAQQDDVYIAKVPAYSTLGWFDDPLLNTFIQWPIGQLAELIIHELAHQRLYIANDTAFNEAFAVAVGRLGARHWLAVHGTETERVTYQTHLTRHQDFLALVLETRQQLITLYTSGESDEIKRAGKQRLFAELRHRYEQLKTTRWDGYTGYDRWFTQDLNNAKLALVSTYHQRVPAFIKLFEQTGGNFAEFYEIAEALGKRPREERERLLAAHPPHSHAPHGSER